MTATFSHPCVDDLRSPDTADGASLPHRLKCLCNRGKLRFGTRTQRVDRASQQAGHARTHAPRVDRPILLRTGHPPRPLELHSAFHNQAALVSETRSHQHKKGARKSWIPVSLYLGPQALGWQSNVQCSRGVCRREGGNKRVHFCPIWLHQLSLLGRGC